MVQQTSWGGNHTSYTKVYFNEFVANVLRDDIGIVIFGLRGHGGCQRPKTPFGGQKYHEGVDLLKRVFNESFSAPSKTPWRIQSDLSYDLRLERYSDLRGHSMYIATRRARLEARGAGFLVNYKGFDQLLQKSKPIPKTKKLSDQKHKVAF